MRPFDAVFLDVGGVFHLPSHEHVVEAMARHGLVVDASRLDRAHYAAMAALDPWPGENRAVWDTANRVYARVAGVPEDRIDDAVAALYEAFRTPYMWSRRLETSYAALPNLAATGVALAIVSNSDGTLEERLLAERLCQVGSGSGVCMSIIVDSGAVGVEKPDPAIFELALAATGVPAERTAHVGDTVGADVDGARAAGIHPLHLDPFGYCTADDHDHVTSLHEVVDLLTA